MFVYIVRDWGTMECYVYTCLLSAEKEVELKGLKKWDISRVYLNPNDIVKSKL